MLGLYIECKVPVSFPHGIWRAYQCQHRPHCRFLSTSRNDCQPVLCAVYAAITGSTPTTHGPQSFDDWFAAHAGRQTGFSMPLTYDPSQGAYSLALSQFWPIDGA